MRTQKAVKNIVYNSMFFIILSIITFVTKKVFINSLGNQFNGLNSLFSSILSFLNLAELGIGGSVIFSLYKPIQEKDYSLVRGIINLYRKMYIYSGIVVIILGFIVTPLTNIFVKNQIPVNQVQLYFIIYLLNTSLSYFFTYKLPLLYVNQENYIISKYDGIIKITKNIVQIAILIVFKSYIAFLAVETVFNLIYYYNINRTINKRFNFILQEQGALDVDVKKDIFKNIKALSLHKIGSFIVFGTDSMLMSYFSNLNVLGIYNNYLMVIMFFNSLISKIFEGMVASIGNLIVSTDKEKTHEVFNKIYFLNFWIVCFFIVCIYNTIHNFVGIWLGDKFFLDNNVLILMLINFYILNMRPTIDRFKEAAGLYHQDRFVPIIESIINFVFSIILAKQIGIAGIILGTIISSLSVIFWLRPIIVYRILFKENVSEYFLNYGKYVIVTALLLLTSNYLGSNINFDNNFVVFLLKGLFNSIYVNLVLILLFRKTDEYKYFKKLILNKLTKVKQS